MAPAGSTVGGAIEALARARDPAGVALGISAGVLKVAGAVLGLALVRPWGRRVPRRLLVAVGALGLAGAIRPAGPVDRTALRWHVLLWDLWFLVWGACCWAWRFGTTVANPAIGDRDEPASDQGSAQNFWPPA